MENAPSYVAYIPAPVRYDRRLAPAVKLMYGEITALANTQGYCWAGNGYFAALYDVDKRTISSWISQLQKCGYIHVSIDRQAGNKRRIYLAESLLIGRPGYSEKSLDLFVKSSGGIEKNLHTSGNFLLHNNITNTTSNNSPKGEYMGGRDFDLSTDGEPVNPDGDCPLQQPVDKPSSPARKRKQKADEAATTNLVLLHCRFPPHWTGDMIAIYTEQWIPYRQKAARRKLLLESVQAQITKLTGLDEHQLVACINDSIANGWSGLFPEKYQNTQRNKPNDSANHANRRADPAGIKRPFEFALDNVLNRVRNTGADESGYFESRSERDIPFTE